MIPRNHFFLIQVIQSKGQTENNYNTVYMY